MPLYNHQIPPGAAEVVHYRLDVPAGRDAAPITVEVALRYRKFDTHLHAATSTGDGLRATTCRS